MKKVFSIFMIFFAVFLVSCGGLLEEEPRNTVRITMPGNGRAVSASGASDVDYYNIQIASQSFSNVSPGTTVESMQLPVGMSISVSVEAIGDLKENGNVVDSGRRVAYYQTSERLPAEGLTLNVNMANYKTEYHKVTLNQNGFNGQQTSVEVYVAGGSSYTLPNYGTYTPSGGGAPRKHTTWESKQPAMVKQAGESITVTEDMEFAVKWDEYATITFETQNFGQSIPQEYCEKNTYYTLKNYGIIVSSTGPNKHTGWSYSATGSVQNVGTTAKVLITDDMSFNLQYAEGAEIGVLDALITWHDDTIYEVPSNSGGDTKYYAWRNESLTLPRGTKTGSGDEVTAWGYESPRSGGDVLGSPGSSLDFSQWTYLTAGYSLKPY